MKAPDRMLDSELLASFLKANLFVSKTGLTGCSGSSRSYMTDWSSHSSKNEKVFVHGNSEA